MLSRGTCIVTAAAPSASPAGSRLSGGQEAGNNPIGQVFKSFYGVGSDVTVRWGLVKTRVVPPPGQDGAKQTWEEYRAATESRREQLRQKAAEELTVIAAEERVRRRTVGLALGATTVALAAALAAAGVSPSTRALLALPAFFSLGFVDSANSGLCTESMAGAWDVDDTGLEYMPTKELAQRIQKKVLGLYGRDLALAGLLTAAYCALPL